MDEELASALSDATFQLGRIDGISPAVDFSPVLYTSLIRLEAVETAEIEGADVDVDEVYAYHTQSKSTETIDVSRDLQEVLNAERALQDGFKAIKSGNPITLGLLKSLHKTLLGGVRNEGDVVGDWRDSDVRIPSPRGSQPPFVPPPHSKVPELMDSLEAYIQMGRQHHPLIDLAIAHYQFETIHPCSDGNGRLGRILIVLQLHEAGYLSDPYLYPSAYFNRNKQEYVEKMRAVSEEGNWRDWVLFFVEGIEEQAQDSYKRTFELIGLRREYEKQYPNKKTSHKLARGLFDLPYFTASEVEERFDVSGQTAYNAIEELEDEGLIVEVTGKKRNQEYKAVDIFDILERSTVR
ncbi:filamentation induced by cAMP protein Fic [Haloferax mucosum ATCC BAA-1512]|uniref:Filamentation induced by cAMP protein Fic n=2 Tax=Haloferax mucosum TaxID=403181 RepID=M0IKW6_9EURY|nr:Fic family protein [Haloferax mucosum]ELZ96094.1 filamentation induced by cAMP protein Fic [Haloferax mucosum ATCC BAA-1512]